MINVLIVDDEPITCRGMQKAIDWNSYGILSEYNVTLHNSPKLATYYREINPRFPADESKRITNCLPYDGSTEIMVYDAEIFKDWGVEPILKNPTLQGGLLPSRHWEVMLK